MAAGQMIGQQGICENEQLDCITNKHFSTYKVTTWLQHSNSAPPIRPVCIFIYINQNFCPFYATNWDKNLKLNENLLLMHRSIAPKVNKNRSFHYFDETQIINVNLSFPVMKFKRHLFNYQLISIVLPAPRCHLQSDRMFSCSSVYLSDGISCCSSAIYCVGCVGCERGGD